MKTSIRRLLVVVASLAAFGCGGGEPDNPFTEFVIAVENETFVVRVSDPDTIRLGFANLRGDASVFPIGPLLRGDGGFNAPWAWHIDPAAVRFTEVAIEVCDGRPSYVQEHVDDYLSIGYCPWGGRVVAVRP